MYFQTKKIIGDYLFIILFVLPFTFFCCKKTSDTQTSQEQLAEIDSISTWISLGRDDALSNSSRQLNLQKAYKAAANQISDSIKLAYLTKIQWSFLRLDDSAWFRKTNKETTLLAIKMFDSIRLAASYWDLGIFYQKNNVVDSAYYSLLEAKKLYEAKGKVLNAGKLEYDMALLQANTKDYTGAETGVIKAIKLLKPTKENAMLYNCHNLLGIILKDLGDYEKSIENYDIAKSYLEKSYKKKEFEGQLENNIGSVYEKKGDYAKAIAIYRKVLSQDKLYIKKPALYARVLNNLAVSQYKLGLKETESEGMFLRSLKIRDSLGDQHAMAGGFYALSKYYTNNQDSTKAIENALKAKSYAEISNNYERLLQSLALLTQLDSKKASAYSKSYVALRDSLQQEERNIRNKFARIQFKTNEVVAQNELLARQRQLWTGIAGALLLLTGAAIIIFYQRSKNQKLRFQQAQQKNNEEIFNLMLTQSEKFEEGKKLEQKRVSEELHDGVLGKMLGVRMMLLGLNRKNDDDAINQRSNAIGVLQDIEGEVRSISHELSHAAYQKMHNFILSIKDLLKAIESASKINIDFTYVEELDWDALNADIKINLYRMIQESIQNAVKHAECENIKLHFATDSSHLRITIADDGKGFVVKKGKKGIGMRNIASRTKKVSGTWDIDSILGKGTTVTLVIPIVASGNSNTIKIVQKDLQEF